MLADRHRWMSLPAATLAVGLLVAALLAALAVGTAQAALKHYDGTVLGTKSGAKTFRIKAEDGRRIKFEVNRRTEFERIPGGFAGLERGLRVEVEAKRSGHGLRAREVERDRDDDRGDDRRGGSDDPPGDDHGHDRPDHR